MIRHGATIILCSTAMSTAIVMAGDPPADAIHAGVPPAKDIDFNRDVRPILVARCFSCHGPDEESREAGLRLDGRIAENERGKPILIPGDSAGSVLFERVHASDPDDRMPPAGEPLSPDEIDAIRRWIDAGAPFEEQWSWQPIRESNLADDPDNIDDFITRRIDDAGLKASPPASPEHQLRRLSFDLTGLPPSPSQLEAFAQRPTDEQYEEFVDAWLDSPRFGEQWGRHWLDLVRYAETRGHEFDYPIHEAWRYRDWVIRAFNQDLPYDRFVAEQVAGDLLEPRYHPQDGTNESVVGTGFWYLGQGVHAPVDVLQDEADRIGNQLEVFGNGMLGLTVACARCHDHKFDPISTADYYALSGFMQSTRQGYAYQDPNQTIAAAVERMQQATLPPEPEPIEKDAVSAYLLAATAMHRDGIDAETASTSDKLDPKLLARWHEVLGGKEARVSGHPLRSYVTLFIDGGMDKPEKRNPEINRVRRNGGDNVVVLDDFTQSESVPGEQWKTQGHAFAGDSVTSAGTLRSDLLDQRLQGTALSDDFTLDHRYVHALVRGHRARVRLVVESMRMDEFNALLFEGYIRNIGPEHPSEWVHIVHDTHHHPGLDAHYELIDDGNGFLEVDAIWFSDKRDAFPAELRDRERIRPTDLEADLKHATAIDRLARGDSDNPEAVTLRNQLAMHGLLGTTLEEADAARAAMNDRRDRLAEAAGDLPAPRRVLAAFDGDGHDQQVYIRGDHRTRGDVAYRSFIDSIAGPQDRLQPSGGSGRLALVDRMFDPQNPFLARVMANRIWHHLFGRGIVSSTDDFGGLGSVPTHPELLDWLAREFRGGENPWSVKDLVRTIVTSDVYRRASDPASDRATLIDPNNELLSTGRVRRLTAEEMRDSLLAISGRIDLKEGGPSVPIHLTEFMTGRGRPGQSGPLDGANRRSVYLAVRRNFANPMLAAFDRPIPTTTVGSRNRSNVPAQALILMNDPLVHEVAGTWAKSILSDELLGDDAARLRRMSLQAFGRVPTPEEFKVMLAFLQSNGNDRMEAWTDVAHAMFNAKSFLYLE